MKMPNLLKFINKKTIGIYLLALLLCFLKSDTSMAAISLISSGQSINANNGGRVQIIWTVRPSSGDVTVVVVTSPAATPRTTSVYSPPGYSTIKAFSGTGATQPTIGTYYKVQGTTTDTSVYLDADSSTATDTTAIGYVLRGVNTSNVMDTGPTTAGVTASTNPNPPAITTQTDGAWVMVFSSNVEASGDTTVGTVSGFTNFISQIGDDTNDLTLATATYYKQTAGTIDPPAWSSWDSGNWYSITAAFRPNRVAPTVETQPVTDVSYTTASGSGNITDIGSDNVTRRGFAWILGTSGNPTTANNVFYEDGDFTAGTYLLSMSGFSPGTAYRVRAYAVNAVGTGYGTTVDLTTTAYTAPTVTTQAVSDVTAVSGSANGNITGIGGQNATRRGFAYKLGNTGDPTTSDSVVYTDGDYGTGAYVLGLTTLISGTAYRVRAYAVNSAGTGYGDTVDLNTLSGDTESPTVVLNSPATGSSSPIGTPTFEFTGTDPESSPVRYNIQIHTDSSFGSKLTFYFNDTSPADAQAQWTNDPNAFDGNTGTSATSTCTDCTDTNGNLNGTGTNAPIMGTTNITQARVRTYTSFFGSGFPNVSVSIFNGAEPLSGNNYTSDPAGWGAWNTLTTPSEGWGWSVVNSLRATIYTQALTSITADVYKVELEVTTDGSYALIDKLSGTDPGFSGSPDNSDPFTSGQLVSYTIPPGSSLNPGTYYWRVRGIDPGGSNTYGSWSETRTLVVTNVFNFDGVLLDGLEIN